MSHQYRIRNERAKNEDVPLSPRAYANLEALYEVDDLHEHGRGSFKRPQSFEKESVYARIRYWVGGGDDIWNAPSVITKMGLRATCLEQYPALAVHLAVNAPFLGRATEAVMALDAGKSLEEVARIAKFNISAATDPRNLRVRRHGKRFKVVVEYPRQSWR